MCGRNTAIVFPSQNVWMKSMSHAWQDPFGFQATELLLWFCWLLPWGSHLTLSQQESTQKLTRDTGL